MQFSKNIKSQITFKRALSPAAYIQQPTNSILSLTEGVLSSHLCLYCIQLMLLPNYQNPSTCRHCQRKKPESARDPRDPNRPLAGSCSFSQVCYISASVCFVRFYSAGNWTYGVMHARWVLCLWATVPALTVLDILCFSAFLKKPTR